MTDDDIPVLTQILRTGDRASVSTMAQPIEPPPAVDAGWAESAVMFDALVIGSEAPARVDDRPAPVDEDEDERDHVDDHVRYAVDDGTSGDGAGDSFRLPQDHDHSATERDTRFDEPEIGSPTDAPAVVAAAEPVEHGERRVNPFPSDEPRERRQADAISLQRLASITSSVRDSVLVALQTRIDTELDARIAQAMHREVETAIAHLQDKLRDGLTEALRDVVARAVDDEMSRFVAAEREAAARLDPRKPPARHDA